MRAGGGGEKGEERGISRSFPLFPSFTPCSFFFCVFLAGGNDDGADPSEVAEAFPRSLVGLSKSRAPAAAGFDFAVAVTVSGDLAVVSPPASGPLAWPSAPSALPSTSASPLAVPLPSPLRGQVAAISAGETHVLLLGRDGTLWAFGRGRDGQLGTGTADEDELTTPRPVLGPGAGPADDDSAAPSSAPGSASPVASFSAGARHSLASTVSGATFAWGWGAHGQCGSPALDAVAAPRPVAGAPGGVAEVAAGGAHSLLRTGEGHVYAFGRNDAGQLGVSGASAAEPTLLDPRAFGFRPAVRVAAGARHSAALGGVAGGELYTWGDASHGQLGRRGAARAVERVLGVRGASDLAAGWWHTLVEIK